MKKNVSVKSGKARTKRLLLTVISAVILIIAAIALFWFWNVQQKEDSPKNKPEKEQEEMNSISNNDSSDASVSDNSLTLVLPDSKDTISANSSSNGSDPSEDRVTYKEGFYYEPLSDALKEKITGQSYKENSEVTFDDLRYVSVLYYNFDGATQYGELICNKDIADDLTEIFYELYTNQYPIESIRLIDEFNADDNLSCEADNTSCFNYRTVPGSSELSKHAYGLAIDINPVYNPYSTTINGKKQIIPSNGESYVDRSKDFEHKIDSQDLCYKLFTEHGFTWGGDWKKEPDYQHFQKAE